jgi:hypothetical protein
LAQQTPAAAGPRVYPYNREAALAYAHEWAFKRNPKYYNYEAAGGDCTNYASQCLFAGTGVMNYTPTYGWYYISANNKAPAWTGVEYFHRFLLRKKKDRGPFGREVPIAEVVPGDFVQFDFGGGFFAHTPIIVAAGFPPEPENILVAAHSMDLDWAPLTRWNSYKRRRFIHVEGYRA